MEIHRFRPNPLTPYGAQAIAPELMAEACQWLGKRLAPADQENAKEVLRRLRVHAQTGGAVLAALLERAQDLLRREWRVESLIPDKVSDPLEGNAPPSEYRLRAHLETGVARAAKERQAVDRTLTALARLQPEPLEVCVTRALQCGAIDTPMGRQLLAGPPSKVTLAALQDAQAKQTARFIALRNANLRGTATAEDLSAGSQLLQQRLALAELQGAVEEARSAGRASIWQAAGDTDLLPENRSS